MALPNSLPPEFDRGVVTTVHQGDCHVSDASDLTYSTVLGSCVSACVRDRMANVGGMNHFLLAEQSGSARDRYGASARYGAFAMEQLINKVLTRGTDARRVLFKPYSGRAFVKRLDSDLGASVAREEIALAKRRVVVPVPMVDIELF